LYYKIYFITRMLWTVHLTI